MASPTGTAYYPCLFEARGDVFSPLFCLAHSTQTGDGNLLLYRSWDRGASWDAPVTVSVDGSAISAPAQRASLTGSMAELLLAYHMGGAVHVLRSSDCGTTWEEA